MLEAITNQYMVLVRCYTFNHAAYIEDAMNGFCMQKTTFPFICAIVDDASTDGEPNIIKNYLQQNFDLEDKTFVRNEETDDYVMTLARHKTNKNCSFAVFFLKYNHYNLNKSKFPYLKRIVDNVNYLANCEGDDYWTHPLKLQKQVDFLEEHEEYSCCCHRFKIYYENTNLWTDDFVGEAFAKHPNVEGIDVTNSENFRTRFTWTLTLCYRKSVLDRIVMPPYKFGNRDFNYHYHLLKMGKGWCFADFMGVYRKNDGGIWSRLSSLEGAKKRLECYEDMYKYNPTDKDVKDNYSYWLNKFYYEYVFPSFYQQKMSKNKIKILGYYFKHCWKAKCLFTGIKNSIKCLVAPLWIKIIKLRKNRFV